MDACACACRSDLMSDAQVSIDLRGIYLSGLTISPEVTVASDRPDLVICQLDANIIHPTGLTLAFQTNSETSETKQD